MDRMSGYRERDGRNKRRNGIRIQIQGTSKYAAADAEETIDPPAHIISPSCVNVTLENAPNRSSSAGANLGLNNPPWAFPCPCIGGGSIPSSVGPNPGVEGMTSPEPATPRMVVEVTSPCFSKSMDLDSRMARKLTASTPLEAAGTICGMMSAL